MTLPAIGVHARRLGQQAVFAPAVRLVDFEHDNAGMRTAEDCRAAILKSGRRIEAGGKVFAI